MHLSRAFRQLPVDSCDFNLLGWTWQGWKYFDKSLIMGMNISPFLCQAVTDAIRYIYQRMEFDLVNYLDDLSTAERWDKADEADKQMGQVLGSRGLEDKATKHCPPPPTPR